MSVKQRYNVSLPEHVSTELEKRAQAVRATPTEYAGDIIRWWFGQGCPPVTHDEAALNKMLQRLKPIPDNIDAWSLNPEDVYAITDDAVVQKLLTQLGIPNLFAPALEHDVVRMSVAFDNHPTHWLVFNIYKGSGKPDGDGLSFHAEPKATISRQQMVQKLKAIAHEMKAKGPIEFSQIPAKKAAGILDRVSK